MNNINTPVIGFMGQPGAGKGTAMEIIRRNTDVLAQRLAVDDVTVYVARKYTTRPSRAGETDKVGDQAENAVKAMLGAYQLMGKHYYAYPASEFDVQADLVLSEPSIHHLAQIKEYLGNRLYIVGLLKTRADRERGLRDRVAKGDTTMDEVEIQKRLDEGDAQEAEITAAYEQGLVDCLLRMDATYWAEDPVNEGKLRDFILDKAMKLIEKVEA